MKTIKQVSELSGASVRALQYYDKINLLSPSRTDSDYRLYSDNDIARLQKILFLKELGFSLKQIRELIDGFGLEKSMTFQKQKEVLRAKRCRAEKIINVLERLENGDTIDDCANDIRAIAKESKSIKKTIGMLMILAAITAGGIGFYRFLQENCGKSNVQIAEPEQPHGEDNVTSDFIAINSVVADSSIDCSTFDIVQIDETFLPEGLEILGKVVFPDDLQNDVQAQAFYSSADEMYYDAEVQPISYVVKSSNGKRYIAINFAFDRTPIREMYAPAGEPSIINGIEIMIGSYIGEYYDETLDILEPVEKYYADFMVDGVNYSVETHGLNETELVELFKSLL